jgi:N-methylhydantoinase A/oxoprolinase/acetone carboxylase beta subunit
MKRIAVDIGGTFTNLIYFNEDTIGIVIGKV